MKKVVLLLAMIIVVLASACGREYRAPSYNEEYEYLFVYCPSCDGHVVPLRDIRIFDVDYLETYGDTLNAMFDYEWTLFSLEERMGAPEIECHHVHLISPHQYLEWTIEYQDGNGDVRHFVFHNRRTLYVQILTYIEQYISEYYRARFFEPYMREAPISRMFDLGYARFIRCNCGGAHSAGAEDPPWVHAAEAFRTGLGTPEGAVRFAALTPANVFERFPLYLSLNIFLEENPGLDQQAHEGGVIASVEAMIETMNQFTNGHLNIDIRLRYRLSQHGPFYSGKTYYRWVYVQGERVFNPATEAAFREYVFERYRAVLW